MPDLRQALKDFVATSNSGKYTDEQTLLSKFPELKLYSLETLRDFVATSNSGKYATEDEVFSKFPEFNVGVSSKKKGSLESATQQTQMPNTMDSSSEDGSSDMVSQSVKDKQAVLKKKVLAKYEEDNAAPYSSTLGKAFAGTVAVLGEMNKSVYQFADDIIVSARKGLQEEGFFDDDIPDTETPITDALKNKVAPKKNKDGTTNLYLDEKYKTPKTYSDGGPLDPTPFIKGTAKLTLKIINSALPQEAKNKVIAALNSADADLKKRIKDVEDLQEYALPEDNIAVNVTKGIVGMAPDLLAASMMKNPAAAEGRLAKWGTEISKDAKPLVKKYVPKATKFIEEAVRAPFTKIMAAKGTVSGIAKAEEGEDITDAGFEGFLEGGVEGVYMHGLGIAAGGVMPKIAKVISKTGLDSKFATAIANPLANAGVFTTAKALRTGIEEQRLISGEEAVMEAATGVGFSLLHAGSLYKNQRELNHYYDNTLKTDELGSFGRVINETKDNLELVYNPNLTETQVKELESARDNLKKAIIKEPDLNNKKLLGDEALKIQNQLDAHSAVKGIVENKDAIIEAINSNENLSEEVKAQKTKKVAAIADFFDTSEFGLQKKELDNKINEAQKKLDDASLGFTNLTRASDRVQAKIEIEKRRAELEGLNNELTNLITNKDAVQEQTTNESVLRTEQPELELQGMGEGNAKPKEVTAEETITNAKPEEVVEPSQKVSDALNNPSGVYIHDGKKGQLKTIDKTLVLETPTEVIDIAYDLDNISDKTLEDLGISQEQELNFKLNEDNSVELNGKKYVNNYSNPESAISQDKEGNYSVTLETENGKKRTFRGQQADQIVYETRLKNFEKNGTERQIEDAHAAADEAIRIETEIGAAAPKREGKSVRKGKQRTLKTVKEPLVKSEREITPIEAKEEVALTEVAPTEVKAEVAPVEEVKDLLDLDTTDKTNLKRVSDYLDKLDKSLDINPNELNDVTRVMAVGTAKAVIKTLKALVDAGVTLQEAIKMASAAHKVKEEQILEALDIVSKINENKSEGISEFELKGYNKFSKVVDSAISNGKTIDNILKYMKRSEVYKIASDVQKELLVRDIRKRFGLREKSAPSVAKLFGKLKDVTKITMSEMKLIHNDIKMQNLGAKQVIKTFNEKKAELTEATDELVKQGKITVQQASNVVKRFAKVNLLSETSVSRFTEYMAKVFNKADYAKKLSDGKVFKKSISKLSRNEDKNVHLTELGKKFAKIDPSMVENLDEYNAIASDVKNALTGSTKRLEKINWRGTVKIEDVAKYIDETIEAQDLKLREEKIAELQDLMGVDAKDFSAEEIDELLKTDKKMTKDNSAIAKATIEKGFDTYSTMIKETIETGKDPFTGEDVSYKPKDIEVVKEFMDMDLSRLTDKQALAAADALHNFLVNESTANMENVLRQYKGPLNAKEFLTTGGKKGMGRVAKALRKYWNKDLGRFITRKGTPMGDVFVKLFKGVDAAADFARLSGFSEIQKGKNYSITQVQNISKDYIKQFFNKKANGEKFNTAYNEAERGIVADLRRSTPGNETAEFKRRVGILDQSIKELEKGTPEEIKKAELYQRVYDKVVEGSKDLSDVESKTDKLNLDAIDFWQKQHELYFDDLANYMLNVHNKVLEKGVNYSSPDRYAKLTEETPAKLLDNEAMYGAGGEHLYKKEASGLMKAEYPEDLPKGRYRDYSFNKNNVNSMRDALIDMNTGGAVRQLEAFRESPEYKKIIPSVYDRNMVNKRMTDYVANTRNKGDFGGEDFTNIMKVLDKTATIGAGMVLGSPLQAIKQTIPIIPNTIINAGKLGFTGAFDPKFNNFLNKSGYATGLRGVESQLEISSLNKKIELAAEGTPEQLAKAIDNASKWWLKTFLVKPDVFMARSSWQAYYEQSLERQGKSTKGIDYSDHKINEKAADYAEQMVSRQQNVSDHDLAGEWFTKNTPDAKILKKIFLNMASFRMNQSARIGADLTTIGHWSTSTTADKVTAARSLAGYGAEKMMFGVLSAAAILGIGSLAKKMKGEEESDVDWEERYNSVLKGQLTSSIVDTFSPAPFLDMGVKAALAPVSEKLEEVTELPLSIYGVQKEDWLQQLGAYGMAPQRLNDIRKAADLGFTGTYEDEFGNVKKISEEDQETIKELLPYYAATGLGVLPADVATGIKDVVKFAKKKVTTDEEVAAAEVALGEKEANLNEKVDALSDLSERNSNPKLKEAADIKISELLTEDPEEKKQLVERRKLEKEAKEFLLYDERKGVQYDNEEDLKKYNRRLWNKNFGPTSQWFKDHKYEEEIDAKLEKELTKREEKEYHYKKRNSDGSSKRKYGSSSRSGGSSKSEMYNSNGILVTKTRTTKTK